MLGNILSRGTRRFEKGWEVTGFRMIDNTNRSQLITKRSLTREISPQRSMP